MLHVSYLVIDFRIWTSLLSVIRGMETNGSSSQAAKTSKWSGFKGTGVSKAGFFFFNLLDSWKQKQLSQRTAIQS